MSEHSVKKAKGASFDEVLEHAEALLRKYLSEEPFSLEVPPGMALTPKVENELFKLRHVFVDGGSRCESGRRCQLDQWNPLRIGDDRVRHRFDGRVL